MRTTFNDLTVFQRKALIDKLSNMVGAKDIRTLAQICKRKNFAVDVFDNCILFVDNAFVQTECLV